MCFWLDSENPAAIGGVMGQYKRIDVAKKISHEFSVLALVLGPWSIMTGLPKMHHGVT